MYTTIFLLALFGGLLQESLARYLSLSLNMSMALSDEQPSPPFTSAIIESCVKETEVSMSDLQRFRMNLLATDPDAVSTIGNEPNQDNEEETTFNVVDYDYTSAVNFNEKNIVSLHCFTYCLYEKLGIRKTGHYVDSEMLRNLYSIPAKERNNVRECKDLEGKSRCEVAYKIHVCYGRLKSLEAEHRIREILESGDINSSDNTQLDDEANDEGATELIDSSENKIEREDKN